MDELERKLKAYYEHNSDYVPGDDFAGRLMALEARTPAAPKRRRRYVLPVAAAIAAALALGSAWAWLHAAGPDRTPDPEDPQRAQTVLEDAPSRPSPMDEQSPDPQPVKEHLSGKPVSPAKPEPEAGDRSVPQFTAPVAAAQVIAGDPTPADDPVPANPAEPAPPASEDAPSAIPPEDDPPAVKPPEDDPPVVKPPEEDPPAVKPPEDDPPAVKPPEEKPPEEDPPPAKPPEDPIPGDDAPDASGPQIVRLEEHDIDASYLMEDGRQTLALRCLSTGASVELDVTGWQEELDEPPALPPEVLPPEELPPEETPAQAAAATYTGRSSIVDVVFDKNIIFYLILEADGTVLVKLDVTEA